MIEYYLQHIYRIDRLPQLFQTHKPIISYQLSEKPYSKFTFFMVRFVEATIHVSFF